MLPNDVNFAEFPIKENNTQKDVGTIAILIGGINHSNPKAFMDFQVYEYTRGCSYNEFIESHLNLPWVRIVLKGINEIDYQDLTGEIRYTFNMNSIDVRIKEIKIISEVDGQSIVAEIDILFGGCGQKNPKAFMDEQVSNYVKKKNEEKKSLYDKYNQFVESHLDMPWTRIIVWNINNIKYEKFIVGKHYLK